MALDLTAEQKAQGSRNFAQAAADLERMRAPNDPTRRTFIKSLAATGAVVPLSAAVYFGYDQWKAGNKPVKFALIGTGDEGNILVGDHNKEFNQIVAVCDVRPYNMERIFEGEKAPSPRKGLKKLYGNEAPSIQKYYSVDELLNDKDKLGLEGVIIATPLLTHRPIVNQCLDAGLHVLCEKLMARTISDCKAMIAKAKEKGLLLSIGHQRHYSMLYAHALEVVQSGILGDIKHIRALWHRNNSWPISYTAKEKEAFDLNFDLPAIRDGWYPPIRKQDSDKLTPEQIATMKFIPIKDLDPSKGYAANAGATPVSYYKDLAELVRWRTSDRTGGGLMAELGSHQLDASSIFLGKVKPISVSGTGVRSFYGALGSNGYNPRECEDGVFTTYEFPGPNYAQNKDDVVVVTYSSVSTNGFEDYGECLMGSRGTMIVEKEANVYLFKEKEPGNSSPKADGGKATGVTVTKTDAGKPVAEASSSWGGGGGAAISKGPSGPAWDSDVRGYRTEMEHFAFLIRQQQANKLPGSELYKKGADGKYANAALLPKCHGEVAMADAILALCGNMAMKTRQRIEFAPEWFNPDSPEVPETKYAKG